MTAQTYQETFDPGHVFPLRLYGYVEGSDDTTRDAIAGHLEASGRDFAFLEVIADLGAGGGPAVFVEVLMPPDATIGEFHAEAGDLAAALAIETDRGFYIFGPSVVHHRRAGHTLQ